MRIEKNNMIVDMGKGQVDLIRCRPIIKSGNTW